MPLAQPTIKNPYPGLRPFEADESDRFFGRETQTDELLRRLGRSRFVAVVGTSGSGKSSLVLAGLLPALQAGFLAASGSQWRIAAMRPGGAPLESLGSALHAALYPDAGDDRFVGEMLEITLRRSSLGLVEAARQARLEPHENLLVVVDQFEELFRFRQAWAQSAMQDPAASLLHLLLEAVRQGEIPIYVMITMRSDFLGDCAQFRDLSEAINDGLYLIPRMTRDQLRLAITAPAAMCGTAMTPRLVQELLNDVNDDPDQLPVLQHALMRTWSKWQNKAGDSNTIDLEDYEATGGMAEALSRHANEILEELSDEPGSANKQLAKKMFQCLTEKGPDNREVRRPTKLRDLCRILAADEALLKRVIEHYREEDRAFLMPPRLISLDGDRVIDISHESFIRKWHELRGWVEEEAQSAGRYRRLAEAARMEKRGEAGLWTNPQLQRALDWRRETNPTPEWAARYDPGFEVAMSFLDRSVAEHEAEVERDEEARSREKKAARMRRSFKVLWAGGTVLVVIFLVSWWGMTSLIHESRARDLATHATLLKRRNDGEGLLHSLLLATESMKRIEALESEEALRLDLALLPKENPQFRGNGPVKAIAFSPNGRSVAAADDDGALVIEAATGKEVTRLKQEGKVNAIAFSPEGRYLAAGDDGTTLVIERATGKEVSRLKQGGKVDAVAFSPDGRYVAAASGGTALVVEAGTGTEVSHLKLKGTVNVIAVGPGGRYVAAASDDGTLLVMEAATGNEVSRPGQEGPVDAIAFSPDGRWVAVGGGGADDTGFASLMSLGRVRPVFRTFLQSKGVKAVAFSPNSRSIAIGGYDCTARLFRLDTGVEQWRFLHQSTVNAIAFSEDGRHLATASSDHTARVIEVATGKEIARLPNEDGDQVLTVAISPDGELVATGSENGKVRIVESHANEEVLHVPGGEEFYELGSNPFSAAVFSPDQRHVAAADKTGAVRVTDIPTGRVRIGPFENGKGEIYNLHFSSNSKYLATAGTGNKIRLIDLATGNPMWKPQDIGDGYAFAFSHDDRSVIIGDKDGNVRFLDLSGNQTGKIPLGTGEQIWGLAASPSGDSIAVASSEDNKNSVRLLDVKGGRLLEPIPIKNDQAYVQLIFSPNQGRYLAIISGLETVSVIEVATGKQVSNRPYPKQWISSAAFSADGQMVAIGFEDGTVRVIQTSTGLEIHALTHDEPVYDLAFSTDKKHLLVLAGQTVYGDILSRADLLDEACSRLSPNLTEDQKGTSLPEVVDHERVDFNHTCPVPRIKLRIPRPQ